MPPHRTKKSLTADEEHEHVERYSRYLYIAESISAGARRILGNNINSIESKYEALHDRCDNEDTRPPYAGIPRDTTRDALEEFLKVVETYVREDIVSPPSTSSECLEAYMASIGALHAYSYFLSATHGHKKAVAIKRTAVKMTIQKLMVTYPEHVNPKRPPRLPILGDTEQNALRLMRCKVKRLENGRMVRYSVEQHFQDTTSGGSLFKLKRIGRHNELLETSSTILSPEELLQLEVED